MSDVPSVRPYAGHLGVCHASINEGLVGKGDVDLRLGPHTILEKLKIVYNLISPRGNVNMYDRIASAHGPDDAVEV